MHIVADYPKIVTIGFINQQHFVAAGEKVTAQAVAISAQRRA